MLPYTHPQKLSLKTAFPGQDKALSILHVKSHAKSIQVFTWLWLLTSSAPQLLKAKRQDCEEWRQISPSNRWRSKCVLAGRLKNQMLCHNQVAQEMLTISSQILADKIFSSAYYLISQIKRLEKA